MRPDGVWSERVIYNFGRYDDGYEPEAGVIFGASGNLYGATAFGGEYDDGAVYEVTP